MDQCQPQTSGKSKGPPELGRHVSHGEEEQERVRSASRLGNGNLEGKASCPAPSQMSLSVHTALGGEQKGDGTERPLLACQGTGSHTEEVRGLRPFSWAPPPWCLELALPWHGRAVGAGGDCHQLSCCLSRRNKVPRRK